MANDISFQTLLLPQQLQPIGHWTSLKKNPSAKNKSGTILFLFYPPHFPAKWHNRISLFNSTPMNNTLSKV